MARAHLPPFSDPEQAKLAQRLLDKLEYYKEVLLSIRNASSSAAGSVGSRCENGCQCEAVEVIEDRVSYGLSFLLSALIALAMTYDLIGASDLHDPRFTTISNTHISRYAFSPAAPRDT